jgi:chaperonin GroES
LSLRPLSDRVIVQPDLPLDTSPSGLLFVSCLGKEGAPEVGTIVAAGPGRVDLAEGETIPLALQNGDRVLFKRLSGFDYKAGGKSYYICRETEILGKVGE